MAAYFVPLNIDASQHALCAAAKSETIILESLFISPTSVLVLIAVVAMVVVSVRWFRTGQRSVDQLTGGLHALRRFSSDLSPNHPVRKRIESAPVVEISLEEVAKLMATDSSGAAVEGLLALQQRNAWIERFAQTCVHLGILGTVMSLVASDPNDMESFRGQLPMALGTTFWGLIGTLCLSTISGWVNNDLERTGQLIRRALIDSFDQNAADDDPDDDQTDSVPAAQPVKSSRKPVPEPVDDSDPQEYDDDPNALAQEHDDSERDDSDEPSDRNTEDDIHDHEAKSAAHDDDLGLDLGPPPPAPAPKPAPAAKPFPALAQPKPIPSPAKPRKEV